MDRTELVIGRGEVYFDRFLPGTQTGSGERYIGNTTAFQIERRVETVDRRISRRGVRTKTLKEVTAQDYIVTFTSDNITYDNLGDWIGGDPSTLNIAPLAAQSETVDLVPGRFYQLGLATWPATGARNLFGLSVRDGAEFINGLYVDEVNGRFGVPIDRTDLTGVTATVEYEIRNSKSTTIAVDQKAVKGAIRFIGRSPAGTQTNYYFPSVLLTPRDQVQLKGDDWMTLTFEAEVLADMVIYEAGRHGRSPGEAAIIAEGLSTDGFVVVEGVLQQVVNG